ncbi:MAG TPA: hypothetical protein VKB57_24015 [Acidimicrobiales bacterium]|nr:hypothetical protein [Acidimicrobiales bacterium]
MVSGTDSTPPAPTASAAGAGLDPVAADPAVTEQAVGLVGTALDAVGRAGMVSAGALGDALEGAGRTLARRVVSDAAARRTPLGDRDALARSLATRPVAPVLASATAAAMAVKVASRFRRLKFLAKRSPMWLLATAVPALVASVARGADELGMVASYLVGRARSAGVEPDLERVRRVAVQIVSHRAIEPSEEPGHGRLAIAWLRRAARAALPFTSGVATADPEGLAAAAESVDPAILAPQ